MERARRFGAPLRPAGLAGQGGRRDSLAERGRARHTHSMPDLRREGPAGVHLPRRRGVSRPPGGSGLVGRLGRATCTCARTRPAPVRDLWLHEAGCGAWLLVERDTVDPRRHRRRPCRGGGAVSRRRGPSPGDASTGQEARRARPRRPERAVPLHLRRPGLSGVSRRHRGLGAARLGRAALRAVVQVPPAARGLGRPDRRSRTRW